MNGSLPDPRRLALAALALALAAPPATRAQAPAGPVEIGDLDLDGLLDPRVAAVSLHEEAASSAPASAFVLTAEDLRAHGYRTLSEALRSVPGLFTYSDGFYQYVGFRGVGLLVDYTVRTLVLVDGHRINNALGQAENGFGLDFLVPLSLVDRIEVVKGPVGSVYGPAAFLGVINVVTRDPGGSPARVAAGSNVAQGRAVASFLAASGAANWGEVAVAAGAEAVWTPGYAWTYPEWRLGTDRPAPPDATVRGMDFGDAQKGYLRATWRGASAQGGCGRWFRGLPSAPYSTIIGDRRNREETISCFAQAGVEGEVARGLVLSAKLSHDWFQYRDLLAYADPEPGGGGDVGPFRDYGLDRWMTLDLLARWQPTPTVLATLGATGDRHLTRLRAWAEQLPSLAEDPVNGLGAGLIEHAFSTVNAHALAEWRAAPDVTLHGGLTAYRHQIFGSRLTPRAAVVWRAARADTLKAVYTEGFRAPSASEAFFDDVLDYIPNLALRPETARHAELSWEHHFGVATATVSGYLTDYRDLIRVETVPRPGLVGPPDPSNPLDYRQQARNGGDFQVLGADLGIRLRLPGETDAFGGLVVQRTAGDVPPNTASLTANAALTTRAAWRPLAISLRGALVGRRPKEAAALLPGQGASVGPQVRLDATALLDVPGAPGLSLEASVLNLLDAAVLHPVANDFAPLTQMAEPPRTLRVALRYRR